MDHHRAVFYLCMLRQRNTIYYIQYYKVYSQINSILTTILYTALYTPRLYKTAQNF